MARAHLAPAVLRYNIASMPYKGS